ncbi:MAG: hypothetical protein KAT00_13060, partial [Planctomycetes bacterium]|nr:hypothetical protein [Planctomycetota bacterium]
FSFFYDSVGWAYGYLRSRGKLKELNAALSKVLTCIDDLFSGKPYRYIGGDYTDLGELFIFFIDAVIRIDIYLEIL